MKSYQPTIGLEIHTELKTKSKMFCSCSNNSDEKNPNVHICPVCTAQPGALPVINKEAIRKVIKTGLSLNCQIHKNSKFDRKNYFYPDLPKGYQISQYDAPLCGEGYLKIGGKKIGITRVHLEEDTGKLIHPEGEDYSLVDLNRAGVPLMELVTDPDIHSAQEARKFAEELQLILRYLGVSDADMEKGQMRVEVNISLSTNKKLGTKVEIKNLNSFRSVEKSIEYEIIRQENLLKEKKKIIQETRGWNDVQGITVSQREKEEAHDYRYFPEPDIPPLNLEKEFIDGIKAEIPEIPSQKRKRFKKEFDLDEKTIEIFVQNRQIGEYFEKSISELPSNLLRENLFRLIKLTSNYLTSDLQGLLKGELIDDRNLKITPENFAEFIILIHEGKISSKIAKMVLEHMFKTGADPSHIIEEQGLVQINDEGEIEAIIKEIISNNPKTVEDYKKGKENAFQFLIGQTMAKTKGKANPQKVNGLLKEVLTKMK